VRANGSLACRFTTARGSCWRRRRLTSSPILRFPIPRQRSWKPASVPARATGRTRGWQPSATARGLQAASLWTFTATCGSGQGHQHTSTGLVASTGEFGRGRWFFGRLRTGIRGRYTASASFRGKTCGPWRRRFPLGSVFLFAADRYVRSRRTQGAAAIWGSGARRGQGRARRTASRDWTPVRCERVDPSSGHCSAGDRSSGLTGCCRRGPQGGGRAKGKVMRFRDLMGLLD